MAQRTCPCGSGLPRTAQYDGHNIFLCYTCDGCHAERMSGFRSDIRTRYDADEPIEPD